MAISFKTDSGVFGSLTLTGTAPADFRSGINSSGSNYLENAYITGSDGSWIKLDNSADVWEVDGTKVYYSGGNVGIGTSDPVRPLYIKSTGVEELAYLITDATTCGGLTLHSETKRANLSSNNEGTLTLSAGVGGSSPDAKLLLNVNDLEVLRVTPNGSVGIGTASPASLLEIAGTTNPELRITDTNPGSAAAATLRAENSSVTLGAYSDHPLYLVANNTTQVAVTSSGYVGIGTSDPLVPLDVIGNLRALQSTGGGASVFTNFQAVGGDTTGSQVRLFDSRGAVPITLNSNGVSSFTGGSLGIGTNSPLDYDGESDDLVVYNATHAGITIASADSSARGNLRFADGTAGLDRYRGAVEYDHNVDTLSLRASGVSTIYVKSGIAGIGTSSPSSHSDLTLANFGSLCLKETTTPTSDTNFGKLYTKSDNSLYFQDGAGTESAIALGGGSSWSSAPASATSAGTAGDRAYDSNYYYVCVATNTWRRTSLATW